MMEKKIKINKKNKGSAIYLSIVITLIMFGIGLTVNSFLIKQIKLMSSIGYSIIAFYAADTGIEHILYEQNVKGSSKTELEGILDPNTEYEVIINTNSTNPDCVADNYCIKSIGSYRENYRAIEINY